MNIVFFQIQLPRFLKNSTVLFLVIPAVTCCFAAAPLPDDMHNWAISTIDNVYREDLKKAEEDARKIVRKYPGHPAGYFFMAVVTDSWMQLHQSNTKEDEFYNYCDQAIEKGEQILEKNPKDEWAKFFIGGANGYKGTYEARYEKWITAFRYGWKGVSTLLDLKSSGSNLIDINYGIGSYEYWRSALMKILWWMPGIADNRESGIKKLYLIKNNGIYTKSASSLTLINILLNEKRYNEALTISNEMLKYYPSSSFFLWGKVQALYEMGKYHETVLVLQQILSKADIEPDDNHYNGTLGHLWLAKTYLAQKRFAQAIAECDKVNSYKFSENIEKRVGKFLTEIEVIRKKSEALNKR